MELGTRVGGGEYGKFWAEQIGYWHKAVNTAEIDFLYNNGDGILFNNW
jgi:hypothetical protein